MSTEPAPFSARLIASAQRLGADPAEYAAHLGADKAPPLTAEQRDRIAAVLSAPATGDWRFRSLTRMSFKIPMARTGRRTPRGGQ